MQSANLSSMQLVLVIFVAGSFLVRLPHEKQKATEGAPNASAGRHRVFVFGADNRQRDCQVLCSAASAAFKAAVLSSMSLRSQQLEPTPIAWSLHDETAQPRDCFRKPSGLVRAAVKLIRPASILPMGSRFHSFQGFLCPAFVRNHLTYRMAGPGLETPQGGRQPMTLRAAVKPSCHVGMCQAEPPEEPTLALPAGQ